jgi:hypothetical protein
MYPDQQPYLNGSGLGVFGTLQGANVRTAIEPFQFLVGNTPGNWNTWLHLPTYVGGGIYTYDHENNWDDINYEGLFPIGQYIVSSGFMVYTPSTTIKFGVQLKTVSYYGNGHFFVGTINTYYNNPSIDDNPWVLIEGTTFMNFRTAAETVQLWIRFIWIEGDTDFILVCDGAEGTNFMSIRQVF